VSKEKMMVEKNVFFTIFFRLKFKKRNHPDKNQDGF